MGQRLAFWGVLLLAAGLRLYQLGGQSFWLDEVYQVVDASMSLDAILGGYLELDPSRTAKSPLSLVLHHFLLKVGDGEFLLRLPSVLFSTVEVAVVFFLARALLGFPTAALAALLLAVSPLHIWYAQETRYYALWTLLITCSFSFLVVAWRGGEDGWSGRLGAWAGYVTSMAASVGAFVATALVLPWHWLSAALLSRHEKTPRSFSRQFVWIQAIFLTAALPALFAVATRSGGTWGTPRDTDLMALPYTFFTFVAGFSVGPTVAELHFFPGMDEILLGHPEVLLLLALFAPLAALGVWGLRKHTPAREILLPWAFGLPGGVYAITIVMSTTYNVRYALPALTAFTIVLAVGIVQIAAPRIRRGAVAAAVLCMAWALSNYYFDSRYHREDVRAAVAQVRADGSPIPVAVTGQIHPVVAYYGEGELDVLWLRNCRFDVSGMVEVGHHVPGEKQFARDTLPRRAVEEMPGLWLMSGRDWRRRGLECLEWLEVTHRVVERRGFTGVELMRLVRLEEGTDADGPVDTEGRTSSPPPEARYSGSAGARR